MFPFMRRRPLFLQAFLALVLFWLAANVPAGGTPTDVGVTLRSVHSDTVAVSSPHATIGGVATSRKGSPSDWAGRLFLPSRSLVVRDDRAVAPSAFALSGIRDRESLTFTYDATAPPAAILNTVR
jgi:hypothetical protein